MKSYKVEVSFEHYANTVPWEAKVKLCGGTQKLADFSREPVVKRNVPVQTATVTREEYKQLAKVLNITDAHEVENFGTESITVTAYEELPRRNLELPEVIMGFYPEVA